MDFNQRLELQKMCRENNVSDQTDLMRELKHSSIIREEINKITTKRNSIVNPTEDEYKTMKFELMVECEFLFKYYTDIFNRVVKDEIDMNMMNQFLDMLEEIENGKYDQHEASFKIGKLLKEMYIDSALKTADKLNKKYDNGEEPIPEIKPVNISWKEYKDRKNP